MGKTHKKDYGPTPHSQGMCSARTYPSGKGLHKHYRNCLRNTQAMGWKVPGTMQGNGYWTFWTKTASLSTTSWIDSNSCKSTDADRGDMKQNHRRKSKHDKHFERLNGTSEQVAKAIMSTPPKSAEGWKYTQKPAQKKA